MANGRFVVLGLAQARSPWFRSVAQWANSGSIPVEFLKCMSAVELRAHLASGRAFSALVVDGGLPALDRDLVEGARAAGCAVVVVDDLRVTRDWLALGANAVVNPMFERKDLLDVLGQHAVQIGRGDRVVTLPDQPDPPGTRARVATVCGAGGTGASTAAIALAQGLADTTATVLLADLALHAEQAMLHDVRDVVPGVQELVDAYRSARPNAQELHNLTFDIDNRGYQLLLGLRRARFWSAVRPRAFAAAFDGITSAWDFVVCDIDAEFEGEDEGGSADVEERHVMARIAAARADAVVVVGVADMKGIHGLGRVIGELLDHEVPAQRIISVINRGPRSPRVRASLSSAIAQLLQARAEAAALSTPVFLPERRVDEAVRDGVRLPPALSAPLAGAVLAVTTQAAEGRTEPGLQPIRPGSLGHWAPDVSPEPA